MAVELAPELSSNTSADGSRIALHAHCEHGEAIEEPYALVARAISGCFPLLGETEKQEHADRIGLHAVFDSDLRSVSRASPAGPASAWRRPRAPNTRTEHRRDGGCRCSRAEPWRRGEHSVEARSGCADAMSTIRYRVYGIRAWRSHNGRDPATFRDLPHPGNGRMTKST